MTKHNMLIRVKLDETDDTGKQQTVKVKGRAGEQLGGSKKKIPRLQTYGMQFNPPKGSIGSVIAPGGNMDNAMVIGLEHADHRPTGLAPGEGKIYDMFGGSLYLQDGKWTMNVGELRIVADLVVIESNDINLGGLGGQLVAVMGSIDSAGHAIVSATATKVKAV